MKKIVSYLAVLVVSLFTFVGIINAEEKIGDVDISTGTKVIYIGRTGCGFCQAFVPGLEYLSKKYNFKYEYIDTDVTSNENIDKWLEKLDVDPNEFGTPTFGVFKNGVLKESHIGFIPEQELFEFLQKNGVIGSDKTYEPEFKNIKYITDQEYLDIISSNKKSLVLLSQYTCSKCINSKSFLDELATELNVDINYYNLAFSSQEDYDNFANSSNYVKTELDKGTLATPTFIVVKGKDVRAVLTDFEGKDEIKAFINDYLIGNKVQDKFVVPTDHKKVAIIVLAIALVISLSFNAYAFTKLCNKSISMKETKSSKKEVEEVKEEKPVVKKTTKAATKTKTETTKAAKKTTKKTNSKK